VGQPPSAVRPSGSRGRLPYRIKRLKLPPLAPGSKHAVWIDNNDPLRHAEGDPTAVQLAEMTWPAVAGFSKDAPIVVPIAALEQHGRHLPVFTDSMLLQEVVRRASEALEDQVIWAPLLWLGSSDHHLDFAGTLSAAPRTYLDVLGTLVDNLVTHGFRRIVFLNGHGGNIVPAQQAIFEARQRSRSRQDLLLVAATYWLLGASDSFAGPALVQDSMGHACEWETSMILHLAPHLVGDLSRLKPVAMGMPFTPAAQGWITRDRSTEGHIGDPGSATADKGAALFRVFAQDVVDFLKRVINWDGKAWNG
jgi:creatinine amidohydrolase